MTSKSLLHPPLASRPGLGQIRRSMFRLTRQERRLVIFLLAAFLAGLGLKHWRDARETKDAIAEMPTP